MNNRAMGWARTAVQTAVAKGALPIPKVCEACGGAGRRMSVRTIQYHHWSYERQNWLDVIPMCASCHARMHIGQIAEPRTGRMYPTIAQRNAQRAELDEVAAGMSAGGGE